MKQSQERNQHENEKSQKISKNQMMPKAITGGNETETLKDKWLRQWLQQTYAIYKQKNIKKKHKKKHFFFF